MTSSQTSTKYSVSAWEVVAIISGALLLVSLGFSGVVIKFVKNASEPTRVKAIAERVVDYQIPGESKGWFGINIGSGKIALVGSADVQLLAGKLTVDEKTKENDIAEIFSEILLLNNLSFSRIENKNLCGINVPVTIEKGELSLSNQSSPVPAIRYRAKAVFKDSEQLVILRAIGKNAEENVERVFNSLKCK